MRKRGRPRKHEWFSYEDLKTSYTPHAQYLKWSSANNTSLQIIAATGCPMCHRFDIEFRHDKIQKIIRFNCTNCHHETSFMIRMPEPGSYEIVPILEEGVKIGEKIVDFYHPVTIRQRNDSIILRTSRSLDYGKAKLGGEWCIEGFGSAFSQKRYYANFAEVQKACEWRKMQLDHERNLQIIEEEWTS